MKDMTQIKEMYYAIQEAIQVMEHYDTGEDFALVSSLRRLRESEAPRFNANQLHKLAANGSSI